VAPDDQQGIHREAVPQPADNVVMQNEMQYPRHIDPVNYNAAYYHYPIPPVGDIRAIEFPSDSDTSPSRSTQ
jgi:hypothetical protein